MGAAAPSQIVLRLIEAADALEAQDPERARELLQPLVVSPASSDPLERVGAAFARALDARLRGDLSGAGNLYEGGSDPRDMLAAFQVLADATPFIRFGHSAANAAILEEAGGADALHLVDVGIGSGVQWSQLVDRLSAAARRPPAVRLTGIDIPVAGADSLARLQAIGQALTARAAAAGVDFAYTPIVGFVQDLDLPALLEAAPGERLAVNAALALHHVPDETDGRGGSTRDAVLARIRAARPALVTLVEPDVEHNALPFRVRVMESLLHYVNVFHALDATLAGHPLERATLEQAFFGREIVNILAGEGVHRIERHERREAWAARMRRHGFAAVDARRLAPALAADVRLDPPFGIEVDAETLTLTWRDLPILAASAWKTV